MEEETKVIVFYWIIILLLSTMSYKFGYDRGYDVGKWAGTVDMWENTQPVLSDMKKSGYMGAYLDAKKDLSGLFLNQTEYNRTFPDGNVLNGNVTKLGFLHYEYRWSFENSTNYSG